MSAIVNGMRYQAMLTLEGEITGFPRNTVYCTDSRELGIRIDALIARYPLSYVVFDKTAGFGADAPERHVLLHIVRIRE